MDSRWSRPSFATAALLAFAIQTTGCAGWHSVGKDHPAEFIAQTKPRSVRVSLAESTLVLNRPFVRGDSIVGLARGLNPPQQAAVPTSDIRKLEVHTFEGSTSQKVMLGTIGGLALVFLVLAIAIHPHLSFP